MKFQDYYDTLEVSRTATPEEIQKAFRKAARKYHPDVNKDNGAEDRFKQVNEAYEVLSDPEKRKRYDALGANWKAGQDFRPPPEWGEYFNRGEGGAQFFGGGGGGFSDFFETLFGGGSAQGGARSFRFQTGTGGQGVDLEELLGGGRRMARQGSTHEAEITVSVEDLYSNATKAIALESVQLDEQGRPARNVRQYQVRLPPGTREGSVIRLAGQGGSGAGGGTSGDLLLRVKVAVHPAYRIDGHDLVVKVPVTPWEAALGGKVPVTLPEARLSIAVPPGTQSGQRLRLRGRGLPRKGEERGDAYAEIQIAVPKTLTAKERELMESLRSVSRFDPRSGA